MATMSMAGIPKVGKQFNNKIKYDDVSINCHTINGVEFKSVFFVVEGWFDLDTMGLNNLKKNMSNTIKRNMDTSIFIKDKIISYTEFPRTLTDGFGFSMFEFTIFLKHVNLIDTQQAHEPTRKIMDKIYEENFINRDFRVKNLRTSKKRR